MSRKTFGLQFLMSLLGTGVMSVAAYGQCNTCQDYSTIAPEAPVAHGCNSCEATAPSSSSCSTGCGLGGDCDGDPWTLFGRREDAALNIGGWFQLGYHSEGNGLFNNHPDQFALHQAWLFVEKAAVSENGELGLGFRFDGVYGLDGPDTQSFGNTGATFDVGDGFARGAGFGWALPQIYGEIQKGDWNVKVGHFYTLVGYEVVTAPDNFFYSKSITLFNSEPFTHTGALATYDVSDRTTLYGGWTAGWDSGFDFAAGSNFLGGFSTALNDDASFTYITTFGDFGARSDFNDDAYGHSMVLDLTMTENWNTVIQSDLTRIESTGEDTVGLNVYNILNLNSCVSVGSRTEWWKGDDVLGYDYGGRSAAPISSTSYFAQTFGLNYRVNPNLIFRPEVRFDWAPALDYEETVFGIDMVATF